MPKPNDAKIIEVALSRMAILSDEPKRVRERADALSAQFTAPREEWGYAPYGVLGAPPVQAKGCTREHAERACNDGYKQTPVRRYVLDLDGVEWGSPWMRVPTKEQLAENPLWPAEVPLD